MSVKTEYRGANIEEAINNACSELDALRDNLDIEIISAGSAGIFGFCKRKAVISAVVKKPASRPAPAAQSQPSQPPATAKKATSHNNSRRDNRRLEAVPPPPPETLAEIAELLREMLNLLDFKIEVETALDENNRIKAQINCAEGDEQEIIGREGENIDAIQYLLRKVISHRYPQKIFFSIDVGNYRERRKKHLESLALSGADKVKATGRQFTINALNPAERRIVHVTLQDDAAIRSVSIGDGLFKKIKIYVPGKNHKKAPSRSGRNQRN